ncbi:hypothetical protein E4P41_11615 [Geodermatophilus sp. DF01-2]|uniref:hypothetical protein n=1 Tax=Geodermatophilus sp. DF01-2 TaxID=2559610 RepID=UPI001104DF95|nr:hypothetical protein [Geodermatophilus sp. DF01_2]TFV59558.1 hypothetical protein E4P41_11615 [Geodermatophilus sp. DF01_2]
MKRSALVLAVAAMSAACDGGTAATGFASEVGVLGCANLVAWGTVAATESVPTGFGVTFDVDEWVHPAAGETPVVFLADHPDRQVGAPEWPEAERMLVVVSGPAPATYYTVDHGAEAVAQWREAGSPRHSDEECARA